MKQITDMETWLLDNEGRVFRYLVYKRMFTPYEQENRFVDQSEFEDTHFNFGVIEEAVDLGNGDWMLGFREVDECAGGFFFDEKVYLEYHKLSDIRLEYYEKDQDLLTLAEEDDYNEK